jgi:hypothetical protein
MKQPVHPISAAEQSKAGLYAGNKAQPPRYCAQTWAFKWSTAPDNPVCTEDDVW